MPPEHRPRQQPLRQHEVWVISLGYIAIDETHARTAAQHAARRLATVLPGFDKNYIAISREADPAVMLPLYCEDDIYCAQSPDHDGPCRSQDGNDLDTYDPQLDDPPVFGADL